MQNERNIYEYCQIRVRTYSILPMANYVTDGQCVFSTQGQIKFAIVCMRSLLHRIQIVPSLLNHLSKLYLYPKVREVTVIVNEENVHVLLLSTQKFLFRFSDIFSRLHTYSI